MFKTLFIRSISAFAVIGSMFLIYRVETGVLYDSYQDLFDYRRLHPDFLPNKNIVLLTSGGHTTTYADVLWINLIQYIGDNARDMRYKTFLNPLISTINDLHPYFSSPYNLALIMSPILNPDKPTYASDKLVSASALEIGKKGIENTCDREKIEKIAKEPLTQALWDNTALKDPCRDGMLPYNAAYTANELGDTDRAELYYKVASMNSDSPQASRFLGTLVRAKEGDHLESAERFLLIAVGGYDEDPFTCQSTALDLLTSLKKNTPLKDLVSTLRTREKGLSRPKDTKNPLATSPTNCYESTLRAMKQIYLGYITEVAKARPEITDGDALVEAGLLRSIPSIESQDGWNVVRSKSGVWGYTQRFAPAPKKS